MCGKLELSLIDLLRLIGLRWTKRLDNQLMRHIMKKHPLPQDTRLLLAFFSSNVQSKSVTEKAFIEELLVFTAITTTPNCKTGGGKRSPRKRLPHFKPAQV